MQLSGVPACAHCTVIRGCLGKSECDRAAYDPPVGCDNTKLPLPVPLSLWWGSLASRRPLSPAPLWIVGVCPIPVIMLVMNLPCWCCCPSVGWDPSQQHYLGFMPGASPTGFLTRFLQVALSHHLVLWKLLLTEFYLLFLKTFKKL